MNRIAILASGEGTNAEAIARYFAGSSQIAIALIVTDNPAAGVLRRAAALGIPARVIPRDAAGQGAALVAMLQGEGIDFLVLAGFLRLLPPCLVDAYRGRILNIHPSLLPRHGGKGMYGRRVHEAVLAAGERRSGITIHLVDEHYDNGAPLAHYTCRVLPGDTPDTLAARIHRLEHRYFPRTIERYVLGTREFKTSTNLNPSTMKLLLISNSTNAGEAYLQYPMPRIGEFLQGVREVVFVPYAAVTFSYTEYERKVQARFSELGIRVRSLHRSPNPARMIRSAEAICVGGGNTFALAKKMQEQGLMTAILNRIRKGVPYVGWSAGSNVACPTICTTNDMPIVEPESFRAIGAVRFQINPHYLDANPEGHAGETREQRIQEYIEANPRRYVAGLREGCMLRIEEGRIELIGPKSMRIFKKGCPPREVQPGEELQWLL